MNKYEREQFAELHKRISSPLYIFIFALIPLIILKFSKKPGDDFFLPITVVSTIAFIFQITQITFSNLLVERNDLVYVIYILPIISIALILIIIFLENTKFKKGFHA